MGIVPLVGGESGHHKEGEADQDVGGQDVAGKERDTERDTVNGTSTVLEQERRSNEQEQCGMLCQGKG